MLDVHALLFALATIGGVACAGVNAANTDSSGAIQGTITYRADAARPWRYARYYVKNARSGELADAIVALRGKGLENTALPQPQTVTIDQKDFAFQPELVAIRRGDSVTFTNSDNATHNVRASGDVAGFNVTMAPGGGNTIRFDKASGIHRPVEVGCVFHSNMKAWVFVFDHPFYGVTGLDGRFKLENVPSGAYVLEVVHPAGGMHARKAIHVKPGQTLTLDVPLSTPSTK